MEMGGIGVRHGAGSAAGSPSGAAPSPRLASAAHEFEGQMMKELLAPMTGADGLGDGEDDSGSGSALGEFASESLARAISQQGGFGIADRIVGELSHFGPEVGSGKVTRNLHANTVLRVGE